MSLPKSIRLADYAPPPFLISDVDLDISLDDDHAAVRARLSIKRNPMWPPPTRRSGSTARTWRCSGSASARALTPGEFVLDGNALIVEPVPDAFILETESRIEPQNNTRLMGLYASKTGYFTQCEAEGFHTYLLPRSSRRDVALHDDDPCRKAALPGAAVRQPCRRRRRRRRPALGSVARPVSPKPCYLFALVAARLDEISDRFVTRSGKTATLQIFVQPGKREQGTFAMACLKKAMRWDEEVFGLELDLDQYTIVAVDDFNMGAMENKGLNIFNSKYVLANPQVATDADYMGIDRVVAHEYFHNWTGNRVPAVTGFNCR
ncbi:MAG: M1 family aminopeptidase [Hyphomicrobiales bacterium]